MSQDGVDNTEMDLPEEPEAHLPSELVGDMRLAYGARLPRAGAALRSLLENGLARPEPQIQRSFRGSLVRLATVSLALFGTMSGLAVAGALPAPVQNAVSGVAETVGFDIPDSQPPAEQVVVGSGSSEDGTDGADGAGGDSTSQNAAPSTTPGSSGADDSDSPTVVPEAPATPASPASPANPDRSRTQTSTPRDSDPDPDDKKVVPVQTTEEPDTTPTSAEPDPTTTTEPSTTSTTTTTTTSLPPAETDGVGSPMGDESPMVDE